MKLSAEQVFTSKFFVDSNSMSARHRGWTCSKKKEQKSVDFHRKFDKTCTKQIQVAAKVIYLFSCWQVKRLGWWLAHPHHEVYKMLVRKGTSKHHLKVADTRAVGIELPRKKTGEREQSWNDMSLTSWLNQRSVGRYGSCTCRHFERMAWRKVPMFLGTSAHRLVKYNLILCYWRTCHGDDRKMIDTTATDIRKLKKEKNYWLRDSQRCPASHYMHIVEDSSGLLCQISTRNTTGLYNVF